MKQPFFSWRRDCSLLGRRRCSLRGSAGPTHWLEGGDVSQSAGRARRRVALAAATELCELVFFFFSFSLFFSFLSFSPPPFFSFSSFSFFLFFFFFFFKVGKETPRRQEADLQDFRVLLKGLGFFFFFFSFTNAGN